MRTKLIRVLLVVLKYPRNMQDTVTNPVKKGSLLMQFYSKKSLPLETIIPSMIIMARRYGYSWMLNYGSEKFFLRGYKGTVGYHRISTWLFQFRQKVTFNAYTNDYAISRFWLEGFNNVFAQFKWQVWRCWNKES